MELFEHFHSEEHNGFLQDCSITLIDKTDASDLTRREEYWCVVLKTVAFQYVFLLVQKLVMPYLVYHRGQRYLPQGFPVGGALEVGSGFWGEHLWRPVISVLLSPGFRWIFTLAWVFFCVCAAYFWGIFLLDCFWVTASVKLLLIIIVSFVCTTLTLFMCFMLFYVVRNSPNCDIFYCTIIIESNLINAAKIEKLEYNL